MAKAFTIMGMLIAVILIALFSVDLAIGLPFQKASMAMDIGMIVASVILALISFQTMRETQ